MATLIQNPYAEVATGGTSQTLTLTQAVTVGNLVVVMAYFSKASGANITVSSITNDAGAMTFTQAIPGTTLAAQGTGNPKLNMDIWYILSATLAPTKITVTYSGASNGVLNAVGVLEYADSSAMSFSAAVGAVSAGSASPSSGAISATSSAIIVTGTCDDAGVTVSSIASPFTLRGNGLHGMADAINQATASYTPTFTLSASDRWASGSASFTTGSQVGTTRMNLLRAGN